jgi:hypothetical protein
MYERLGGGLTVARDEGVGMVLRSLLFLIVMTVAGEVSAEPLCQNYNSVRDVFFGDLHVHTVLSMDARIQDTRNRPADAYRFARGQRIGLQPYDGQGRPTRFAKITRPLDFAAVTDHAEMLGEARICDIPGSKGHYSIPCLVLRHWNEMALFVLMSRASSGGDRYDFCGADGSYCREQALVPWEEIRSAARSANSPCAFSAFAGYEWTGSSRENIHRNIIFRSDAVVEQPISFFEHNSAGPMLAQLQEDCSGDCEAISIPHNSNLSGGLMFPYHEDNALSKIEVHLRARMEPLAELIQHKGSSECFYQQGADELCAFEQLPYSFFSGNLEMLPALVRGFSVFESYPPAPKAGYLRSVLNEGFKYDRDVGINPYQLGFIGSTDTHLGIAGEVSEYKFQGHGGAGISHRDKAEGPRLADYMQYNPGGLAAVWAEENTRESLFAAMKRRETYATSGPRIRLRMFAGYDYDESMCNSSVADMGYAGGVPMGGTIQPSTGRAPRIMVEALADVGTKDHPATPLQRIQIIKGWVDDEGQSHHQVYNVAGEANNGAGVNYQTCESHGEGSARLCAVWEDPDFKSGQHAYYYSRALENPSCRWSARACLRHDVNCNAPDEIPASLQVCCLPTHRKSIQERAISSPIWHKPKSLKN